MLYTPAACKPKYTPNRQNRALPAIHQLLNWLQSTILWLRHLSTLAFVNSLVASTFVCDTSIITYVHKTHIWNNSHPIHSDLAYIFIILTHHLIIVKESLRVMFCLFNSDHLRFATWSDNLASDIIALVQLGYSSLNLNKTIIWLFLGAFKLVAKWELVENSYKNLSLSLLKLTTHVSSICLKF